ncbi:MAG TPA: sulfatase-like hydrolase/transferase [Burkholderiaceae bacterium]|nr:sulfatase-like hydrolase/transferase [Burkholderiaceae bacterium]
MSAKRPNLIVIMTDQQRYDTIAALGYPYMQTPTLDRLAAEGTAFSHAYVAGASCVPSRASLFTGYYPHTTGILRNADLWRHSWVERLAAAGYHCVNVGKMHTWPMNTPCGFHQRYTVENKDRFLEARYYFDEWDKALAARGLVKQQRALYRQRPDYRDTLGAFEWELPEDMHSDVFVGNLAQWWIRSYPVTQPLFLQIGFVGPHPPYDPTARYAARYMDKDLPLQEPTADELSAQPEPLKAMRIHNVEVDHDSVVHQLEPPRAARHRQRAFYLANVTMIDEKVGEILGALSAAGYLDDAIVVFTSDHGDCLGDHGHSQKWTMYEQVLRVPLIVWAPGRVRAGARCDALVQQMDLVPFLLEQAGVAVPDSFESESLAPALRGDAFAGRDAIYAEQMKDLILTDAEFVSAVRTRDYKLVHFLGQPCGQLYDLTNDPEETRNLWSDASATGIKRELLDRLMEWRIASQYRTRNWMQDHR